MNVTKPVNEAPTEKKMKKIRRSSASVGGCSSILKSHTSNEHTFFPYFRHKEIVYHLVETIELQSKRHFRYSIHQRKDE